LHTCLVLPFNNATMSISHQLCDQGLAVCYTIIIVVCLRNQLLCVFFRYALGSPTILLQALWSALKTLQRRASIALNLNRSLFNNNNSNDSVEKQLFGESSDELTQSSEDIDDLRHYDAILLATLSARLAWQRRAFAALADVHDLLRYFCLF
jgi:hypothetical protein